MRALQITALSGPDSALELVDLPEPEPSHVLTPGRGVIVDVHNAGVSFPEVLQTRGEYQIKPPLPFVPGSEVGGVVRSAPAGAAVAAGDRVAAFCMLGGSRRRPWRRSSSPSRSPALSTSRKAPP
jgi:NADPH2:quinone reductase